MSNIERILRGRGNLFIFTLLITQLMLGCKALEIIDSVDARGGILPCRAYAEIFFENPWLARVLRKDLVEPCSNYIDSDFRTSTNSSHNVQKRSIVQQADDVLEAAEIQAKWRWNYIDEQSPGYKVLNRESSIENRLANIIYTIKSAQVVNTDAYIYNTGDTKEDEQTEKRSTGSKYNETLCGQQLNFMAKLLDEFDDIMQRKRNDVNDTDLLEEKHIRFARILDSFGRYESGTLMGRITFTGSPDECSGTELMMNDGKKMKSQYCVATLALGPELDPRLRSRTKYPYEGDTSISVGICIPETCHSPSYRTHRKLLTKLIDSQFKLPRSMFVRENLQLQSIYCKPEPDSPVAAIPLGGKVFIAAFVAWLSLVGYATYITNVSDKFSEIRIPALRQALIQLDIRRSWLDFTGENEQSKQITEKPETRRVELDTVNPVKVLGCAFVVFAHVFVVYTACTMDTLRAYRSVETDPTIFMVLGGTLVVDTFYVITGIITGYILMKRTRKNKSQSNSVDPLRHMNGSKSKGDEYPKSSKSTLVSIHSFVGESINFAVFRYLRLVPLYFVVFWFTKSLFESLNPGSPVWDYGINKYTARGACRRENWLVPFTFEAAFKPIAEQCLPPSWSVAGDLFFSVTLAPIVILMTRKPKLAALISTVICLFSSGTMFINIQRLRSTLRDDLKELRVHSFTQLFHDLSIFYTAPHHRVFSPLIGVMAGYFLYFYSESKTIGKGLNEWPGWFKGPVTKLSMAAMAFFLVACPLVPIAKETVFKIVPLHHLFFDHSMTTGRIVWCLANAVIFLRMMTDWKDSWLMKQGTGRGWKMLVKLNYAILLIHLNIIAYDMNVQSIGFNLYSKYKVLQLFIFAYAVSNKFAVALHVLFENPLDKLLKSILHGPPKQEEEEEIDLRESEDGKLRRQDSESGEYRATSGAKPVPDASSPV